MDDTLAYILTDCEDGNPVSAPGVGGNMPLLTVDLGQQPKSVKCSPHLEVAISLVGWVISHKKNITFKKKKMIKSPFSLLCSRLYRFSLCSLSRNSRRLISGTRSVTLLLDLSPICRCLSSNRGSMPGRSTQDECNNYVFKFDNAGSSYLESAYT